MLTATLHDVLRLIDRLPAADLPAVQRYTAQRLFSLLSPDERVAAFRAAVDLVREGLTEEDWDEIEWAMNHEYIEPIEKMELDVWDEDK